MKSRKNGIQARHLKSIFKSFPNITDKHLAKIKGSTDKKTYKTLRRFSGLISYSVIKDLEKETSGFMQMAEDLKDSIDFAELIEETNR